MAKAKKRKSLGGRPAFLEVDPALASAIAKAVEACYYLGPAAASCGIEPRTAQSWSDRGARETSGVYVDFVNLIKKARAKWEADRIESIRNHGKKSWQAEAWLLERMGTGYRLTSEALGDESQKASSVNFIDQSNGE